MKTGAFANTAQHALDRVGTGAGLRRLLPFLAWLPRVNRGTLSSDLVAALTGAIVVLPQGVAFATIAGMPPEYGLYAGMVPAIIAALFGSSWHLVSGPTTAASIVLFSSLSALAEPGSVEYVRLALTLTLMVGAIQLFMGFARLGTLVNFISHSVIVGFTAGAAVLIGVSQLKHFFGVPIPRGSDLFGTLHHLIAQPDAINPYVLAVSLVTLFSGIALKRYLPRVPYMIGAMLIGSLTALLIGGPEHGIATVGALPDQLPPLSMPAFDLATLRELAPTALAVTLFALTEAVSIARSIAIKTGQHIDGSQEFVGQGLSNVVGSFFSGYVATGSFNRSGLNYEAGAKTPLAAVFAGVLLMGIVVLVAPLAAYLPNAAMAGVLMLVAWGLVDGHHIRKILRASQSESAVMTVTFLSALLLDLEFAILLGVGLSLIAYLNRTSRPHLEQRVPDPNLPRRRFNDAKGLAQCPKLRLVRIDGSLFFGAVSHVAERLRNMEGRDRIPRDTALIAHGINFIDVAGAEFLVQEAARLKRAGRRLYLFRVKPAVLAFLERGGYLDDIGRDAVYESKSAGIAAAVAQLDHAHCSTCSARVFVECQELAVGETG
ncbi:MAG: sulfate permease [Chromatiaceae bacterium]|nr:sulfate permease [Gammaproteobacteria bacterium]MCP5304024.1 sulfate permease [Chromatiaceae bacterium]MCP5313750.1 sulfate permease [Chromatiaceae bacterium]